MNKEIETACNDLLCRTDGLDSLIDAKETLREFADRVSVANNKPQYVLVCTSVRNWNPGDVTIVGVFSEFGEANEEMVRDMRDEEAEAGEYSMMVRRKLSGEVWRDPSRSEGCKWEIIEA